MIQHDPQSAGRLLIVGDLARLGPILARHFAPQRIDGVHTYLDGIAEIPRATTEGVIVAHDETCRKPEAAIAAMKSVARQARVVFCCEPAYESLGRRLLDHGADDYVIFPPEGEELEQALGLPTRATQARWVEAPVVAPVPTAEELARLADVLSRLSMGAAQALDALAALLAAALRASHVTVLFDGLVGRAGQEGDGPNQAVLVEPIVQGERRVGQLRIGPCRQGAYSPEDTTKLRHYGVLIARLLESAGRADQWRKLAMTDDLTGLPNRRALLDFLEQKLVLARDARTTVTALVFDIDEFKRYNDTYGHDAGDEILCEVGRLFLQCSRKSDMVARYGGDEFVVIFWDPEGPRSAGSRHPQAVLNVVERFREALRRHTFTRLGPEAVGCLTISGGLAHYPWQARTAPELIEAADQALLQAKQGGKNRFWLVGDGTVGS